MQSGTWARQGLEHPDVAQARRTGWPCGAAWENADTPQERRAFAEENLEDFLDFIEAGDAGVLEEFVRHYHWRYRDFLN